MAFWKNKDDATTVTPPPGTAWVKHLIAVGSGKGGVGKSTVAANLAIALKREGLKVGMLDADIYGPSQTSLLGWGEGPRQNEKGEITPVEHFGIKMVSMGALIPRDGPVVWRAPMAMKVIHQFLDGVLWGELDVLILDLPPGTGDVQLTLAQSAKLTGAVIVSTPQKLALEIAQKGIRMFQQVRVPILGLVENMSGFVCGHCGKETDIFKKTGTEKLASAQHIPFLGRVPLDPTLVDDSDRGEPALERSGGEKTVSGQAFVAIARELLKTLDAYSGALDADQPLQAALDPTGKFSITWPDGHKSEHHGYRLRVQCGCASCIDENTGKRTLDPTKIPTNTAIKGYQPIGRYAFGFEFSDGHRTGIYPYDKLRKHCECTKCLVDRKESTAEFTV